MNRDPHMRYPHDFAALEAAAQRAQEREDDKSLTDIRLIGENIQLQVVIARQNRMMWKMVLLSWLAGAGTMYGLLAGVLGR